MTHSLTASRLEKAVAEAFASMPRDRSNMLYLSDEWRAHLAEHFVLFPGTALYRDRMQILDWIFFLGSPQEAGIDPDMIRAFPKQGESLQVYLTDLPDALHEVYTTLRQDGLSPGDARTVALLA